MNRARQVDLQIPDVSQMDAPWLKSLLESSAAMPLGARIVTARAVEISIGRLARTVRFVLEWADDDCRGPGSLVGKFPAAGTRSRQAGYITAAYSLELDFYRRIAPTAKMQVPQCYLVRASPATGRFALILEDVSPGRTVDQIAGATVDDVAAALVELSRLHAQHWGRQADEHLGWVPVRAAPERSRRLAAAYKLLHRRFLDRSGELLSHDAVRVIERFDAVVRPWLSVEDLPRTLLHGDYRVENLIFDPTDSARPVTVLDWQNLGIGPGASDVAYLIGGSLPIETRRDNEADLVRLYLDALAAHDIEVSAGAFRSSYAVNALAGLHMAVVSAMLVDGGPGSDDLFVTMAERHSAHARDLDALGALS